MVEAAASEGARANRALLVVSSAVLLASSTWFSGTAAIPSLRAAWGLSDAASAWITIAVQLGFIVGTVLYAALNVADIFNPRLVFALSAFAGAATNLAFATFADGQGAAVALRFLTGLTLAGVYPVGMKIVATWFRSGLGWRLGVMVGALTMGTAAPYLLRSLAEPLGWRLLVAIASAAAVAGGTLILLGVGDGPHRSPRARFDPSVTARLFRHRPFRENAFGYFGHMWELYAVWSLISFYLSERFEGRPESRLVPLWAFAVVAAGTLGCVVGGWISGLLGERRVALFSLMGSGTLCALSGFAWVLPAPLLLTFLVLWGILVVADSPQFSALAARYSPPEYVATALTVQNGIGFLVTVVSLQILPLVARHLGWRWAFMALAPGPALGAYFMWRLGKEDTS